MRRFPIYTVIAKVLCAGAMFLVMPGNASVIQAMRPGYVSRQVSHQTQSSVRLYVTTLKIPTYQYQNALIAASPEDSVYPYPRLDFNAVGPPVSKQYTAIVLDNPYLSITVLPSLGGRIYRIRDRVTGRDITYRNPVIKPTHWGIRGWWLATGGIEWAFPTEEHGLNEWRSWKYYTRQSATQASITVHDTEERTGMIVWVRITLDGTHAYLTLEPGIHNPTTSPQPFQLWLNGMLSLSDNQVSDDTRFVLPASNVRIHSTGDSRLPSPGTDIAWPNYDGRDLSLYRSWQGYLGFFAAPASANFAGAYDTGTDQGVARIFQHETVPGVKFFAPRGLDPGLWTDNQSSYFELWGGVTATFWDTKLLEPGQTIEWAERWYPVSGLRGAFNYADDMAAVRLAALENRIEVAVAPTQAITGKVALWWNGARIIEWPSSMRPGRPFRQTWGQGEAVAGTVGIQILDRYGNVLARYGNAP